jgi:4-hydroxy-3-polyprenylbenzoate decarboxylase
VAIQDNRQFIQALEKNGDLVRVKKEIDWDLEAGAIIRRLCETSGPAALFEKVKDYPDGYRILGGPLATYRRLAIALGLEPETTYVKILEEYGRRLDNPIKPRILPDGPCKENLMVSNDIDLFRFPVPMVHGGDGGRYIGTWHLLVTKDPDSEWVNWGMYRLMVYDRKTMAGLFYPNQHGPSIFYQKYKNKGKAMPFAVAIGADPICSLIAASRLDWGASEVDYAGALLREPVDLVKCETNDLLVPAHAEIVIEGEISADDTLEEGPFGEFTGYSSSPRTPKPACKVKAVSYRNEPIFTMTSIGFPTTEDHITHTVNRSYFMYKILKNWGIPVTGVFVPPAGAGILVIVGVKPIYSNIATQVAKLLTVTAMPNYVIVVDDETDIYNMEEVMHAFATKCHPIRGIRTFDSDVMMSLIPFYSHEERTMGKGAKAVFDCTFPTQWQSATPRKITFGKAYPEELQDKVLENWKSYGFE